MLLPSGFSNVYELLQNLIQRIATSWAMDLHTAPWKATPAENATAACPDVLLYCQLYGLVSIIY